MIYHNIYDTWYSRTAVLYTKEREFMYFIITCRRDILSFLYIHFSYLRTVHHILLQRCNNTVMCAQFFIFFIFDILKVKGTVGYIQFTAFCGVC